MADTVSLARVEISALHGHTDLDVRLRSGLNVVYGRNGTGKTTLLHIVANVLDGDIERFSYLRFREIRLTLSDGSVVSLHRKTTDTNISVLVLLNGELLEEVPRDASSALSTRARLRALCGGRPVYLPAFRAVLEAIARDRTVSYRTERTERELQRIRESESGLEDWQSDTIARTARLTFRARRRIDSIAQKTVLCRSWFGQFVPVVRFPSLTEVSDHLSEEYEAAELDLAQRDRIAFSEVFVQVLRSVFESPDRETSTDPSGTLESIRRNLESLQERSSNIPSVYNELASLMSEQQGVPPVQEAIAARILALYDAALQRRIRAQRDVFRRLRTFENSVNRFLQGKHLRVGFGESSELRRPRVRVKWEDGREGYLHVLSSGERHILTLLFSATHMPSAPGVFLIDEPELSLHLDWQRVILGELMQQVGDRQIIACTHAPEVAADYPFAMVQLQPTRHSSDQGELFTPGPDPANS